MPMLIGHYPCSRTCMPVTTFVLLLTMLHSCSVDYNFFLVPLFLQLELIEDYPRFIVLPDPRG